MQPGPWADPPSEPPRSESVRLWLALAVTLGVSACVARPEPLPPGVMAVMETEQTASFVRNFNPLLEGGADRWPTLRAMYEPLAIHNPATGEWVPWLAERFELSPDGLRLRFFLRPGVKWSDGRAFTARDVEFTFALMKAWKPLDARGLWARLSDVQALDAATVEVVLARPAAPAFEEIAQQAIVPEHVWKDVPDPVHFANERPVATGPFTEVRFFGAQGYEVARNPHYWQTGRPAVEALRFRAFPSNESALLALLNDEVDWAGMFVPAIERVYVARDPAHHHYWHPLLDATVFLYANAARPPFDDERARKALSMAIDRARIVKVAMNGHTRPADATGLSDAYARYRDSTLAAAPWVNHDPEAAGQLFDELGWRRGGDGVRRRDGRVLAVTMEVPTGFSDWIAAAQIMARDWRRLGLQVTVRASEYPAWFERLETGAFELSMCWSDLNTTPYGFYRSLMSTTTVKPLGDGSSENWHRVGLPAAEPLFAALEATVDRADERRNVVALEALFAAHAPAIPLFPGPLWGEFNSRRIAGFPSEQDPYAPLSPNIDGPQPLLVLTRLSPVAQQGAR